MTVCYTAKGDLLKALLVSLWFTSCAVGQQLDLRLGRYVLDSVGCKNAPNAAIIFWDGVGFSSAHTSGCTSQIVHRSDPRFDVTTTCTAQGDGSPNRDASPTKVTFVLTRLSVARFVVDRGEDAKQTFRWCSAKKPE